MKQEMQVKLTLSVNAVFEKEYIENYIIKCLNECSGGYLEVIDINIKEEKEIYGNI